MKQWLEKTVCKPGFNNILIPNLLWQASSSCAISNPRAQCSIIMILQTMARVVVVLIVILLVGLVVGLVLVLIHVQAINVTSSVSFILSAFCFEKL